MKRFLQIGSIVSLFLCAFLPGVFASEETLSNGITLEQREKIRDSFEVTVSEDLPFEEVERVVDGSTTYKYLDNGEVEYTLTTRKKPYFVNRNGEKEYFWDGWSLFGQSHKALIEPSSDGYEFGLPVSEEVIFRGDYMQVDDFKVWPKSTEHTSWARDGVVDHVLEDLYPGVDYVFTDDEAVRRQSIVIKEQIGAGDSLMFWDEMILPEGALVRTGEGDLISAGVVLGEENVVVEIGSEQIHLGHAIVFDESGAEPVVIEREVIVEGGVLKIGLKLSKDYLAEALYPVTIDPDIYACDDGNENELGEEMPVCELGDVVDFYTSSDFFANDNTGVLKMGYGYHSGAVNDRHYAIGVRFNLDALPEDSELSGAWLQMYYDEKDRRSDFNGDFLMLIDRFRVALPDDVSRFNYGEWNVNGRREEVKSVEMNSENYGWWSFDIKGLTKSWLDGTIENHGLLLEIPGDDLDLLMEFDSSRNISDRGPNLKVRYHSNDGGNRNLRMWNQELQDGNENESDIFRPADQMAHNLKIRNQGVGVSGAFTVKYYLGEDDIYDDAYLIGEFRFPEMDAFDIAELNADFVLPDALPGNYKLYFWIDAEDEVAEINEGDNRWFSSFDIPNEDQADLVFEFLDIDEERENIGLVTGQNITANTRYCNQGLGRATDFTNIKYYISENNRLDGNDLLINVFDRVLPLGFNFCHEVNRGMIVPNLDTGWYYLIAVLDPDNIVGESDGTNNIIATRFEVIDGGLCGGQCEEGNIPDSGDLPDSDGDGRADLEEEAFEREITLLAAEISENFNMPLDQAMVAAGSWGEFFGFTSSSSPGFEFDLDAAEFAGFVDLINFQMDPVNIRTGVFSFEQPDLVLSGRGGGMELTRFYNSKLTDHSGRLGNGWQFSQNMYLYQDPATDDVNVFLGGNFVSRFTAENDGTFVATKSDDSTLFLDGDYFVYRTLEGMRYEFSKRLTSQMAMIERVVDTNGNVTLYTYIDRRDVPLLSSVTDPSGRSFEFEYGQEDDEVEWDKIIIAREVSDMEIIRIVDYAYDGIGNLTAVGNSRSFGDDTARQVRSYRYDVNSKLTRYTDPRGTILYNEYDAEGRTVVQREYNPRIDAEGESRIIYRADYLEPEDFDNEDIDVPNSTHCTVVYNYRDSENDYTGTHCFDEFGLKIYVSNELGEEHYWTYDENGMPATYTDPIGAEIRYSYDERRRLRSEILPDINGTQSGKVYTYENNFNQVTSIVESWWPVDDVENKTARVLVENEIDPDNGNLLSTTDALGHVTSFTYDEFGNVLTSTDKRGNTTMMEYDEDGNYLTRTEIEVTDVDGVTSDVVQLFTYDVRGNMTSMTDARGNVSTFEYDSHDNLRRSVDALGQVKTYEYDIENNLIRETDELGRYTEYVHDTDIEVSLLSKTYFDETGAESITEGYTYDWVGNPLTTTDVRGTTTTFGYDEANRVNSISNPVDTVNITFNERGEKVASVNSAGQRMEYDYDARGNVVATKAFIDANNFIETTVSYDGFSRAVSSTDGNGNVSSVEYDDLDRVVAVVDALGNRAETVYDDNGNVILSTDKRGNSTTFIYDELNRATEVVNVEGKVSKTYYDGNGNKVMSVDRADLGGGNAGHVMSFEYDALNRLTTSADAYGAEVSYTYDAVGNVLSESDEMARVTSFSYDYLNRQESVTDAEGNTTSYTFDEAGNVDVMTHPGGAAVSYDYDVIGRKVGMMDEDGNEFEYEYDSSSNLISSTDRLGKAINFTYDGLNRMVSETNDDGTTISYIYDGNGNMVSQDHEGQITGYTFDELNRVTEISNPGDKSESLSYDENGNVVSRTNGEDEVITFTYDVLNRVVMKDRGEGGTVTYEYDNWGNMTRLVENSQTLVNVYDLKNRPTSRSIQFGDDAVNVKTSTMTYFADSQLQTVNDAAENDFSYSYDGRGLLETVSHEGTDLATYTYDARGTMNEVVYGNGASQLYVYDDLLRPISVSVIASDDSVLFSHQYEYDPEGNRIRLTENGERVVDYTYDDLHQLQTVNDSSTAGVDIDFDYDQWGNRSAMDSLVGQYSYSVDALNNELDSVTENVNFERSYTYDNNGSLVNERMDRLGVQTGEVIYDWDKEQRLNSITYLDHSRSVNLPAVPERVLEFTYGDDGNRIKKEIRGREDSTVYYVNNGLVVSTEFEGSLDNPGKSVVYGLDLIAEVSEEGVKYVHQDALGSTVMMTEGEEVTAEYAYDVYGSVIGKNLSEDSGSRYLYTGQEYDAESELMYYNARYYNPLLGRFISRDVVKGRAGDSLTRNRYIYVKNNPFKYTDPSGHEAERIARVNAYTTQLFMETLHLANEMFEENNFKGEKTDSYCGGPGCFRSISAWAARNLKFNYVPNKYFHEMSYEALMYGMANQDLFESIADEFEGIDGKLNIKSFYPSESSGALRNHI